MAKRIFYYVMLFSMLHSSFVAPAQQIIFAYFNMQEGLHYKGFRSSEEHLKSQMPHFQNDEDQKISEKKYFVGSKKRSTEVLMDKVMVADIKHGFIGVTSQKPLDDVSDNIFKVIINDLPDIQSKVYLTYELYGLQDFQGVTRSINDRLSSGGHIIKSQQSWSFQKEEIDVSWLKEGENRIMFSIPQGFNSQYQVKNLRIEFDDKEASTLFPLLVTSPPTAQYIKDNKLYVKGFLRCPTSKEVNFYVEHFKIPFQNGEFEGFIELTDEIKQRKFVVIKAVDSKGLIGQELLHLDNLQEADYFFPLERYPETTSLKLEAKKEGFIKAEGASLFVNDSALAEDKVLSITHLRRKDVVPMASGMINVTKGGSAYRFLPDGTKFDTKVSISIEYDEELIPKGSSAKDIRTYYFNTHSKAWIPVVRDTLNEKDKTVVSFTDHFTDYINGIVQTPESPETAGFTPTMMSDIKVADPSSEITLISPPQVSQKGEANISYPLKIPSGRNGMQPQIGLHYNSDGGSGWLGQGWNINVPSLSIDTRWGIPEINDTHETVLYTLGGEQLMYPKFENADGVYVDWMPNRHYDSTSVIVSTSPRDKIANARFTPRKQGSFAKVERLGTNPTNYYWKVTNTDGTISWYGGKISVDDNAVIKNIDGNIVYWSLFMIEDVHLNNIKYTYLKEFIPANQTSQRAPLSDGLMYNIHKIHYTGHNNSTGLYEIEFKRSNFNTAIRNDVIIDGRLGVKIVDAGTLNEILIRRTGSQTLIRKYGFFYKEGEFQKTLLDYVAEFNANNIEFYRHTFDYYNDVRKSPNDALTLFDTPYTVNLPSLTSPSPGFTLGLGNLIGSSKLNTSESIEAGWGITASAGIEFRFGKESDDPFKSLTFNFPLGESYPKDKGYVTMADIDGNGLDDIIYKTSSSLKYFASFRNEETGKIEYESEQKSIDGITNFSRSEGRTKTMFLETHNVKLKFPFSSKEFFYGRFRTKTDMATNIYFTDGNGDGLLDIVKDKMVLFNQLNPLTGGRKFTVSSGQTPNMLITANTEQIPAVVYPDDETIEDSQGYDAVRVWIAPKAGRVQIEDVLHLNSTNPHSATYYSVESSKSTLNNGVPFRLYLTQLTDASPNATVLIDNYAGNSPSLGSQNTGMLEVERGQRIFFRITRNTSGINDEVVTNPVITYKDEVDAHLLIDENSVNHNSSAFQDGFILSEDQSFQISNSGSLSISWETIQIQPDQSTDSVTYKILLVTEDSEEEIYSSTVEYGTMGYIQQSVNQISGGHNFLNPLQITVDNLKYEKKHIRFEVSSSSNLRWKEIQWKPRLEFTPSGTAPAGMVLTTQTKYPVAKYSIYKTNMLKKMVPVSGWTIPNSPAYYNIKPKVSGVSLDANDYGTFTMVVKKGNTLIGKRIVSVNDGSVTVDNPNPIVFTNPANLNSSSSQFTYSVGYYVTNYSDEKIFQKYMVATSYQTAVVSYTGAGPASSNSLPLFVESYYNNMEDLGPMHKEWGQFFYNDELDTSLTIPSDAIGKLINPNIGNRYDGLSNAFNNGIINPNSPCFTNGGSDEQIRDCLAQEYFNTLGIPAEEDITPATIDSIDLDGLFVPSIQDAAITPLLSSRALRKYPVLNEVETEVEKWIGLYDTQYVQETKMKSGSFQGSEFDMVFPDDEPSTIEQADLQRGMQAIDKNRQSVSVSKTVGWGPVNLSKSKSSYSDTTTDFLDLNGDRYPDLMSSDIHKLSNMTGGHNPATPHTYGHLNSSDNDAIRLIVQGGSQDLGRRESPKTKSSNPSVTTPSTAPHPPATESGPLSTEPQKDKDTETQQASITDQGNPAFSMGIGADLSLAGENKEKVLWADLNGDGLPDKIVNSNGFKFRLNTGNLDTYSPLLHYNLLDASANKPIALGLSLNFGLNINALFNDVELPVSIDLSAGISNSGSTTKTTLLDMTGDGLPDLLHVSEGNGSMYINNGNGFSSTPFPLLVEGSALSMANDSSSSSVSIAGQVGDYSGFMICCWFTFLTLPLLHVKGGFTFNGNASLSISDSEKAFKDFNGDGFMDYVVKGNGNTLKVYESKMARTNKLRKVTNPLRGEFVVDYQFQSSDYDNPHPKWVMSQVDVYDGYNKGADGIDEYSKTFRYENGRYDRRERAFYGYETVSVKNNERTSVSKYHNSNYFLNGLLKEAYVILASDETQKFSRTENFYQIRALNSSNTAMNATVLAETFDTGGSEGRRSAAVVLSKSKNYLYELSPTPALTTEVNFTYDNLGRVISSQNLGDVNVATDDYTTNITYHDNPTLQSKHLLNIPASITVMAPTLIRKRTNTIDNATGNILSVNSYVTNNHFVTTTMEYDTYGNLTKKILPENDNGQSMWYNYSYDSNYYKIRGVEDAFGYTSTVNYYLNTDPSNNLYYDNDNIIETIDLTQNKMQYSYDSFGRMLTVRSPKEIAANVPYTIKFAYYLKHGDLPNGHGLTVGEFVPVAVTKHFDPQHPTDDIETYSFIDGLARSIQVKKDIEINTGTPQSPHYNEKLSISGVITYDAQGRAINQYHPHFETKVLNTRFLFNETITNYSSSTIYDALDRPVYAEDAEGNQTTITYSIAGDNFDAIGLKTRTEVQQNGSVNLISETYKDVNGRVVSTLHQGDEDIWTKFEYNPIGELKHYTDAASLSTHYNYDFLGRKLLVNHPDNGETYFTYDNASNLTSLQTANLSITGQSIQYHYERNRLTEIVYPDMPNGPNLSNVSYHYGETGNETGRVTGQKDASGEQNFKYGNMGEVTSVERLIVGPNIPTRIFTTSFVYDSWNRLEYMVYPDQEAVYFYYDRGGNLNGINGAEKYITQIDYDHFEQRTYLKYGNNTETFYNYTPAMRRLENLNIKTSDQMDLLYNNYFYDKAGNVTEVNNMAGISSNGMGGEFRHGYSYDKFNRLDTAYGRFNGSVDQQKPNDYQSEYNLHMEYNNTHGIVHKAQDHTRNNAPYSPNTYQHDYVYAEGTHRLESLMYSGNQVEAFLYDKNGNITKRTSATSTSALLWDESNRLRVWLDEQQGMQHYIYDASGERVLKANSNFVSVFENGSLIDPGGITINSYTTYPNAFMVIDPNGVYSKHYYAGSQRIVSRLGNESADIFNFLNARSQDSDEELDEKKLQKAQIADLQHYLDQAKLGKATFKEYKGTTYQEEEQLLREEEQEENPGQQQRALENLPIYYYHPDHIGTSTFLTDANGNAYQFFLNLPFGETMAEQLPSTYYKTPFKFSGKEMDEETGLHYFGARYYDSRISIWLSVDPLFKDYPNWNPYNYTMQNPINLVDPTGMGPESYGGNGEPPINGLRKAATIPVGMDEAEALSHIVTIDGKKYHKYTSNLFAQVGNTINSLFGGDDYYFVEHKPYEPVEDRMLREGINTGLGFLIGGAIGKSIGKAFPALAKTTGSASQVPYTVVKESSSKISVFVKSGSAKEFYKILNPTWKGTFEYTNGTFSTTSFTTKEGVKVVFNTTSKTTQQPTVKIISKGMQILFRFPKL